MEKIRVTSEISYTLKIIGGKWKPLILEYLKDNGTQRYMEILRYLEGASKKILTQQLRELESDGIIKRTVIPTGPIQVEYTITEYGESLYPVLEAMCDWGYDHFDSERYELSHPTCTEE